MATLSEFVRVVRLTKGDKSSRKRMFQILSILRKNKVLHGLTPEQAVQVLEELGPTYVKIGQVASTRSDILPKEYCDAFAQLHSDVSPMSFDTVIQCIHDAYKKLWTEVFLAIEPTPLGSASIAQVHKAVLLDGSVVAVKVRRPGIVEEMTDDITLMKRLVATAEFLTTDHKTMLLNMESLVDELERTTKNELDFTIELNNLIKFGQVIKGQEGISSPKPYPEHSNDAILVMDYVEGVQIDDISALKSEGDNLDVLANRLVQSYISQVLDAGFFHADPHAGNILVNQKQIIWIDLGMVGTLTSSQQELVSRIFRSVATNDPFMLMQAVIGLSNVIGQVNHGELLSTLSRLLDKYITSELADIDMGAVFGEIIEVLRKQNLVMDSSVTMLARGIVSIEGVLEKLSPSTNLIAIVSQHVIKQTFEPSHIEAKAVETLNAVARSAEAMAQIPSQISNTLNMLNRGELEVRGNVEIEKRALSSVYTSAGRFSLAILGAGLFLGSSIICTTPMEPRLLEVPVLGLLGFIGAFFVNLYVIVVIFKTRHQITNDETPN